MSKSRHRKSSETRTSDRGATRVTETTGGPPSAPVRRAGWLNATMQDCATVVRRIVGPGKKRGGMAFGQRDIEVAMEAIRCYLSRRPLPRKNSSWTRPLREMLAKANECHECIPDAVKGAKDRVWKQLDSPDGLARDLPILLEALDQWQGGRSGGRVAQKDADATGILLSLQAQLDEKDRAITQLNQELADRDRQLLDAKDNIAKLLARFEPITEYAQALAELKRFEDSGPMKSFVDVLVQLAERIGQGAIPTAADVDVMELTVYSGPPTREAFASQESGVTPSALLHQLAAVQASLHDTLQKRGLGLIFPKPGERYDPARHRSTDADIVWGADHSRNGTVTEAIELGFLVDGKVLRQARVRRYVLDPDMSAAAERRAAVAPAPPVKRDTDDANVSGSTASGTADPLAPPGDGTPGAPRAGAAGLSTSASPGPSAGDDEGEME